MKIELVLDIKKDPYVQLNSIVTGRVGDQKSNVVDVHIVDDGKPYSLAELIIYFECMKPDYTTVRDSSGIQIIDEENGHFEYTFPTEVFSATGEIIRAYFAIEEDAEFRATTQNFPIISISNATDGNIESGQYISDLEELINQANVLIEHIKELEKEAVSIVDEELNIIRDHVNKMLEEIQNSVEVVKESIETSIKEIEMLVQGLQKKLLDLENEIQQMIEIVENNGALKTDGSNIMTGTFKSSSDTPFQFGEKAEVWFRQTLSNNVHWFQTKAPMIYSGISTVPGEGVEFRQKYLRYNGKDVLVKGDVLGAMAISDNINATNEKILIDGEEIKSIEDVTKVLNAIIRAL
ncbi:BppU family phage baseplate upper protein [Bacillus cereus]|uniref:BppU family phage baseplate upper protein n=1 Tax=Bacillus cereus TaxID=1396 RepID=UPI0020419752|nr:BppU family phage baseplate upper protein [Bacillus cereus]MCM3223327.1 BppU family phage baseplate upper protein [Bacillus cereus]